MIPPEFFDLPDTLPLASLPGMPPSLSTTATMASLVSGVAAPKKPGSFQGKGRRNSLSRSDTMDRMVLGGRTEDSIFFPMDHGRMKAAYWMECLLTHEIPENEQVMLFKICTPHWFTFFCSALLWRDMTVSLFDDRFDGKQHRCLFVFACLPAICSVSSLWLTWRIGLHKSHQRPKCMLFQLRLCVPPERTFGIY
jgi:anaphase-promoting complex subunit 1